MNNIIKFLLFLTLFSCNFENREDVNNRYEIISLLYEKLAQPIDIMFPPPPPDSLNYIFSSKDSTRIDSIIKGIKEKRKKKKFIVAIYPYLNYYKDSKYNDYMIDCFESNIIKIEKKDSIKIDINKITKKRNDSVIYFKEELILKGRKDYETFDVLISFSQIEFNKTYTKAMIIGTVSTSRLAGITILYFLEKVNNKWIIKCQETLSIS